MKVILEQKDEWHANKALADKSTLTFKQDAVIEDSYCVVEASQDSKFRSKAQLLAGTTGLVLDDLKMETVRLKLKGGGEDVGIFVEAETLNEDIPVTVKTGTITFRRHELLAQDKHLYKEQATAVLEHAMMEAGAKMGGAATKKYKPKHLKNIKVYSEEMVREAIDRANRKKARASGVLDGMLHGGAGSDSHEGDEDDSGSEAVDDNDPQKAGDTPASKRPPSCEGSAPSPAVVALDGASSLPSPSPAAIAAEPSPTTAVVAGTLLAASATSQTVARTLLTMKATKSSDALTTLHPSGSAAGGGCTDEKQARVKTPDHWERVLSQRAAWDKTALKRERAWAQDCVNRVGAKDPIQANQ